jgi:F-type H+-transporting ATPase subunit b
MPQFDPSTYTSQLFWLVLCLGVLVVFMKRVFVPRLMSNLDAREGAIRASTDEAQKLVQQTRELEDALSAKLQNAEESVKALIEATLREHEAKRHKHLERLALEYNEHRHELLRTVERQQANADKAFAPLIERATQQIIAQITKPAPLPETKGNTHVV